MMNSQLVAEASKRLAGELTAHTGWDDEQRIAQAYERVLLRPPSAKETQEWLDFLAEYNRVQPGESEEARSQHQFAWQGLCRVLLSSNEFVYVE
jgi:ATP-dependent exoDNAse (exonuclease V) beta subunit